MDNYVSVYEDGQPVPLYSGRLGMRVHIGPYNFSRSEPPHYGICSVSLAFRTRPEPVYRVHKDRMCPTCLRRALKKGMEVKTDG